MDQGSKRKKSKSVERISHSGEMSGQIQAQVVFRLRQNMRQKVSIKRRVEGAKLISQKIQNKMKVCCNVCNPVVCRWFCRVSISCKYGQNVKIFWFKFNRLRLVRFCNCGLSGMVSLCFGADMRIFRASICFFSGSLELSEVTRAAETWTGDIISGLLLAIIQQPAGSSQ